ncbi:hypothetical protein RDI58_027354 [Solanum bulbocastanum]|jgi:hypothetical protein
MKEK